MSAGLIVCAACERHVKRGDGVCPFCGVKLSCTDADARKAPSRLSRAALLTLGAAGVITTSVAATSCGAV